MALLIHEVTHRFGNLEVLREVSFQVEDGQFCCVVGPSGCGKTTLLRLIAGLIEPAAGRVLVDGGRPSCSQGDIGFVYQEGALFPWRTVEGNIALGLEIQRMGRPSRDEVVERYLDLVGMREFREYYPGQLSAGMRERVAVARALAHGPRLVLMDEPFASLDALSRNAMQVELLRIWAAEGKTVVFVTHNVDEAVFLSDTIVVLSGKPGRVQEIFPNHLPRPRKRTEGAFVKLREGILNLLAPARS